MSDKLSTYIRHFQPVYVTHAKWVPWGYNKSLDDEQLYLPDIKALRILEYVLKRCCAGATYISAARVLAQLTKCEHHAERTKGCLHCEKYPKGRTITRDGVCKLYKKWNQFRGHVAMQGRIVKRRLKKRELENKIGQRVDTLGAEHSLSQEAKQA